MPVICGLGVTYAARLSVIVLPHASAVVKLNWKTPLWVGVPDHVVPLVGKLPMPVGTEPLPYAFS